MPDDKFLNMHGNDLMTSPATHAFTITPTDLDDPDSPMLPAITRAVYVGSGGDLAVVMQSGEAVTFIGVPTGSLIPIRIQAVSDDSSADDLVGLY